jgi:hypothetical protein
MTGAAAGERSRTQVNETETETGGQAALCGAARLWSDAPLRRGDLLGAEPGPGPSRPGRAAVSVCKFVLVGLANHAGPDGAGGCPVGGHARPLAGLSERTVRACLDRLEAEGIIRPCDPH